jgi:hypothetical protein
LDGRRRLLKLGGFTVSVASFSPEVESFRTFAGGTGQCDEVPAEAIDAAAAEWSAQLSQLGADAMESGSDLAALDAAVSAEWDRLLALLPAGGDVYVNRDHSWFNRGLRSSQWRVTVWSGKVGDPGTIRGTGSNDYSLAAAGDAALADLQNTINAAVAAGAAAASLLQPLAPVAAVLAAESRAA